MFQSALNLLHIWCKENGTLLNTDKTKVMFITTRQKRATLSEDVSALKYDDINLHLSNNEKVLGVYIDENLWLLSQIKNYISLEHILLFYSTYMKTHFDYCSIVWGNSSNYNIDKIDKLQSTACKINLGKDNTHSAEARNHLKMLSFDENVFLLKAKVMYTIVNNIVLEYLTDFFQMKNADNTGSNLRSVSNTNFVIPKPNNNLFKSSLSYSGAVIWNSIPLEIKIATSLNSFISKCLTWMKS